MRDICSTHCRCHRVTLTKIDFIVDSVFLPITPSIYDNRFKINNYQFINTTNDILQYFKTGDYSVTFIDAYKLDEFDKTIYDTRDRGKEYALFIDHYNSKSIGYTEFYNGTAPYASYIGVNQLNNALLRYYSKNPASYIKMNIFPLGSSSSVRNYEASIDGFITVLLFGLAFTFIPSSIIVYLIKERESNAKHQQLISGVNIYAYWLTNFLIDYPKYLSQLWAPLA